MSKWVVVFTILSLVLATTGFAYEDEVVVTEVVVRPLGLVALGIGSVTYLVMLPFTIVAGGREKMAEALVKRPYRFTFRRKMGEGLLNSETSYPPGTPGGADQQR